MATIRSILKSSKDADGRYPILLCISDRGKRAYFSTGFSATEKEFEVTKEGGRFIQGKGIKKFCVDRKEEDGSIKSYSNMEANDKLATLETRAKDILRKYNEDHVSWGFEQFRADFTNAPKRESFYAFAKDIIEKEYQSRARYKSAVVARETLHSLELYDAQIQSRSFQDINVRYIEGYMDFCRAKGNSDTTIKIRLEVIRRIYNIAIREKIVPQELYPFSSGKEDGKIRLPKTPPNRTNKYLDVESLYKLENTPFDNHVLERTRHLFLFSYFSRGMNWKDMALLRRSSFSPKTVTDENTHESMQVTIMEYRRSKTKGQFVIQVSEKIQQELDWFKENTALYSDYVLPIIQVDVEPNKLDDYLSQVRKRFNRSLREIAKKLELPDSQLDITSYTTRHSFAMTLLTIDKPIEIISQALGHKDVKTTEHYIEGFSTTRMAEETDIDLAVIVSRLKEKKKSR